MKVAALTAALPPPSIRADDSDNDHSDSDDDASSTDPTTGDTAFTENDDTYASDEEGDDNWEEEQCV